MAKPTFDQVMSRPGESGNRVLQALAMLVSGTNPADGTPLGLISANGVGDSKLAAGVVTAPAALGDIAVLAAVDFVGNGVYEVRLSAAVSGSAVADLNNMRLLRGTTTIMSPIPQGGSAISSEIVIPRLIQSSAAEALTIEAIAVGTAGVEYAAQIVATRIE